MPEQFENQAGAPKGAMAKIIIINILITVFVAVIVSLASYYFMVGNRIAELEKKSAAVESSVAKILSKLVIK